MATRRSFFEIQLHKKEKILKEQALGPCRVGVRGFKSHPPHQIDNNFCAFSFQPLCSPPRLLVGFEILILFVSVTQLLEEAAACLNNGYALFANNKFPKGKQNVFGTQSQNPPSSSGRRTRGQRLS